MKYFIAICLVGVFGCASYVPPKVYKFDKSTTVNKNYDVTWGKIIRWFSENNFPIKNIEKASGFIATEYGLGASRGGGFCDCGSPNFLTTFGDVNANFNVTAEKVSDTTTTVTATIFYKMDYEVAAMYKGQNTRGVMDCKSTGALEKSLYEYVGK